MKDLEAQKSKEVVDLKEYLEAMIAIKLDAIRCVMDERDKLTDTRFTASQVAVDAALLAQKEAVVNAFLASEKAIVKAEGAQQEYNIRSNEFRAALDDQAKLLMPRNEYISQHKNMEDRITILQESVEQRNDIVRLANEKTFAAIGVELASLRESRATVEGKASSSSVFIAYIISVLGIILGIVGLLIK